MPPTSNTRRIFERHLGLLCSPDESYLYVEPTGG